MQLFSAKKIHRSSNIIVPSLIRGFSTGIFSSDSGEIFGAASQDTKVAREEQTGEKWHN